MKTNVRVFVAFGAIIALLAPAFAAPKESAAPVPQAPKLLIAKEVKPVFPLRMLNDGISRGEVSVAINVDERGRVVDLLVIRYTHKEFADAVVPAVKEWEFHPLMVDGQAARAVAEVRFNFETEGVLVIHRTVNTQAEATRADPDHYAYAPCAPSELDRSLKAKHVVKPIYPEELSQKSIVGDVFVEFYVDENGRTRLPVATYAQHDTLGAIAAHAIQQWQFEPPTRQGQPVLVRANQKFKFVPQTTKTP